MVEFVGDGLEKRVCGHCGEEFYGFTGHVAQKNLEEHDCPPQSDDHLQDVKDLPRDLESYRVSRHFHSMKTRRKNPEVTDRVIKNTIENGVVKNTHEPRRYIFEWNDEKWLWWLLVQEKDASTEEEESNLVLVTIYAKNSDEHERVEKYV